ncbi:hypothetical protein N9X66_09165 [Gammaproteobacteria bacterium]|nr:hypothetical protein [Gammaproteobacteria bacterium]
MKKSLLLAALLLSSAVKAETWVCSMPTSYGGNYLVTFIRQGDEFSRTLTIPAVRAEKSRTLEPKALEILVETDSMLTLAEIKADGTAVGIDMINKVTKQHVSDAISFYSGTSRSESSCVEI